MEGKRKEQRRKEEERKRKEGERGGKEKRGGRGSGREEEKRTTSKCDFAPRDARVTLVALCVIVVNCLTITSYNA